MDGSCEVLIVDRRLPNLDGLSLVKGLRSANVLTPVLKTGDSTGKVSLEETESPQWPGRKTMEF